MFSAFSENNWQWFSSKTYNFLHLLLYIFPKLPMHKNCLENHHSSIRMAKIHKPVNNSSWWQSWVIGALIYCWWKCKMVEPFWETFRQFLSKLNKVLPYDPAIVLPDIFPTDLKMYIYKKIYTWMFMCSYNYS